MEAKELFTICRELAEKGPGTTATRRMHELLVLTASEGCRREGGTFGGLFAQVDWLCKRTGMSNEDRREVQTMRRHSNGYEAVDREEWPYDLRALTMLISAVFSEDVPGELRRLLPSMARPRKKGMRINQRYVRCIVQTWDDRTIRASTADGEIVVDYANQEEGRDFGYLRKVLREGMQLNLLDCHVGSDEKGERAERSGEKTDRVVPGVVVVEPDFLVDISSIAACFTNYGHHPLHYTVNRMKPKPNSQAVLLGNFAGTALDSIIHSTVSTIHDSDSATNASLSSNNVSLSSILQRSFKEQALRFCGCRDFDPVRFKADAEQQVKNIKEAVGVLFDRGKEKGRAATPSQHRGPQGQEGEPLGRYGGPQDQEGEPQGQEGEPLGRYGGPQGQEGEPQGQEGGPQGLEGEPQGQEGEPQGQEGESQGRDGGPQDREKARLNDPEKALLEPSFVCERLGLQGRVDLMTNDMNLLVEQKSGKNMKIERQSHDRHGLQLESHYVQLLLYYGILRHNFGRGDQTVDIRLLYSRYPAMQGLMSVSYYQQLFREAIRLRNQIVATELLIAREGFGRIMPLLTPTYIYKGIAKDRIFHEYVEPELASLNAQLASLNPLERAYYERMMTFVYREQACQKLGNSETRLHHSGGATSDIWLMPLSEKRETGSIFTDLIMTRREPSTAYSGYDLITLELPTQKGDFVPNFRRGDMVFLYTYRERPDVRGSILYKGTLEEMGVSHIVVRLTNGQQNPHLLPMKNTLWAVEHASTEGSASAQIRGMMQFVNALPDRRDLLLGQRRPKADTGIALSRSYHPNYDNMLLRASQALDYFLLVGPPGTGKTSMAMRFLVEEELKSSQLPSSPTSQLLLMSYTNRAVDEICGMLTQADISYLRIGSEASCDPRFRNHLLEASLEHISRLDDIRRNIEQTPVIVATTSTVQSRQEILQLKHFSLCIVDEASQILEPSIIGILSSERIDRFILIGDHKQLPAVVQQSEEEAHITHPQLRDICVDDCRQSLFERLLRWEQRCRRTQFVGTLHHQGRMHPDVASFPASAFYAEERLRAVPLPHQQALNLGYDLPAEDNTDRLLKEQRVIFFDSGKGINNSKGSRDEGDKGEAWSDKVNAREAHLVADLLRRIHRFYGPRFVAEKTVGVIVPYRNQIAMIRREISLLGIPELLGISIDTVERYQGSQRDVIIYSFTVTHQYQLDFLSANTFVENGRLIDRKLNVALTRARCQMLITGCADVLRHNPLFNELIKNVY